MSIFAALQRGGMRIPCWIQTLLRRWSATKSFEQFAGFHIAPEDNLTGAGDPMRVTRAAVTANFFSTLGVVPQFGRDLSSDKDWKGAPNVLLLSDRLWRNKFGADPRIIGKAIT